MNNYMCYKGNFSLNTTDSVFAKKTASKFHIEILECLGNALIDTKYEKISVKKYDIILATGFRKVTVIPEKRNTKFRFISMDVDYPAPLNQYLVADNALIHDLMNDNSGKYSFIVFRNLEEKICHNYINLLEILLRKKHPDIYDNFQLQRLYGLLFTELLHHHRRKIAKSVSSFPEANVHHASRDTQSGAIMRYISSKSGQVTLSETAQHFGYQKNYFSRLCHKLFDMDFVHLRINIRMNIAEEQLKLTTKSIEEISSELGYRSISNFTKTFTEVKGMTPGRFRKKYGFNFSQEKAQKLNP